MKINIEEVLNRWTDKIYPSRERFLDALLKRKLVIYHGVDPTAPQLHLGHSTNYLLLRKFQDLGHKVILLIGDFTAKIGDPTGRLSARRSLSEKEIKENFKTYKEQAGKILDFKNKENPVQVEFNSQWYKKMGLSDILTLTGNFTLGQVIKRDMFQERLKKGQEIFLPEFLYPILQGYDSVALKVDAEVGGTDQTFNMLAGRDLARNYLNKEKFVVTTPLLINPKTGKKMMSKSEGGVIGLNDSAEDMYGKVMAFPDEAIVPCFTLCTELSLEKIKEIERVVAEGNLNPKDAKKSLAKELVMMYNGRRQAEVAEKEFEKVHQERQLPTDIPEFIVKEATASILDLLVFVNLASSKSEAKRLILQKGVKINGKLEEDWKKVIKIKKGLVIQAGTRRFAKVV